MKRLETVLDGLASAPVPVLSGVPQGSTIGPILFGGFINELPFDYMRMIVFYIGKSTRQRTVKFCKKIWTAWHVGETDWQMKFSVAKCHWMMVTRHVTDKQFRFDYSLHQETLEEIQFAKYLGSTITNSLAWGQHISEIRANATRTLGFHRRNLAFALGQTKGAAYKTFVRPKVEYAAPTWHPNVLAPC